MEEAGTTGDATECFQLRARSIPMKAAARMDPNCPSKRLPERMRATDVAAHVSAKGSNVCIAEIRSALRWKLNQMAAAMSVRLKVQSAPSCGVQPWRNFGNRRSASAPALQMIAMPKATQPEMWRAEVMTPIGIEIRLKYRSQCVVSRGGNEGNPTTKICPHT